MKTYQVAILDAKPDSISFIYKEQLYVVPSFGKYWLAVQLVPSTDNVIPESAVSFDTPYWVEGKAMMYCVAPYAWDLVDVTKGITSAGFVAQVSPHAYRLVKRRGNTSSAEVCRSFVHKLISESSNVFVSNVLDYDSFASLMHAAVFGTIMFATLDNYHQQQLFGMRDAFREMAMSHYYAPRKYLLCGAFYPDFTSLAKELKEQKLEALYTDVYYISFGVCPHTRKLIYGNRKLFELMHKATPSKEEIFALIAECKAEQKVWADFNARASKW